MILTIVIGLPDVMPHTLLHGTLGGLLCGDLSIGDSFSFAAVCSYGDLFRRSTVLIWTFSSIFVASSGERSCLLEVRCECSRAYIVHASPQRSYPPIGQRVGSIAGLVCFRSDLRFAMISLLSFVCLLACFATLGKLSDIVGVFVLQVGHVF